MESRSQNSKSLAGCWVLGGRVDARWGGRGRGHKSERAGHRAGQGRIGPSVRGNSTMDSA